MSPDDIVSAVNNANAVMPSGVVRMGDRAYIASPNVTVGGNLQEFMDTPVRTGSGPAAMYRERCKRWLPKRL
jgi:hypothetical protein